MSAPSRGADHGGTSEAGTGTGTGTNRRASAVDQGGSERHPRHYLDPVIHFPIRLSIMACLGPVRDAEFAFVRDTVEITAATLSKQVTVLEEAGYVAVRKGSVGRRPRTWLSLTDAGRRALEEYLATMRTIVADLPGQGGLGPG